MNPYTTPESTQPNTSEPSGFEIRGKKLSVRDGAKLPARCIKTNHEVIPGENGQTKLIKMSWMNPAWALLIFVPAGVLVLLIMSLLNRTRCTITVHLSRKAILQKRIMLTLLLLIGFGLPAFMYAFPPKDFLIIIYGGCASLAMLIIAACSVRYLTCTDHQEGWFYVKGFSRKFLNDLRSHKAE